MDKKRGDDSAELDVMELRMGFMQKYGIKGVIVLALTMVAPYAGSIYEDYTQAAISKTMDSKLEPMNTKMDDIVKMVANCKNSVPLLKSNHLDYIARMAVAKQSIHKVKEIKQVLRDNPKRVFIKPQDKEYYEKRIKSKIREILVRNSKVYVNDLNNYQHQNLGRVGDYIWNEFPMDEFTKAIDILTVYSTCADIEMIGEDVMIYMLDAQDIFFTKMYKEMKKGE